MKHLKLFEEYTPENLTTLRIEFPPKKNQSDEDAIYEQTLNLRKIKEQIYGLRANDKSYRQVGYGNIKQNIGHFIRAYDIMYKVDFELYPKDLQNIKELNAILDNFFKTGNINLNEFDEKLYNCNCIQYEKTIKPYRDIYNKKTTGKKLQYQGIQIRDTNLR